MVYGLPVKELRYPKEAQFKPCNEKSYCGGAPSVPTVFPASTVTWLIIPHTCCTYVDTRYSLPRLAEIHGSSSALNVFTSLHITTYNTSLRSGHMVTGIAKWYRALPHNSDPDTEFTSCHVVQGPAIKNRCYDVAILSPTCARNYRPCFRENQPKRSFSIKWKRAFLACFRENWVYKFGHCSYSRSCHVVQSLPSISVLPRGQGITILLTHILGLTICFRSYHLVYVLPICRFNSIQILPGLCRPCPRRFSFCHLDKFLPGFRPAKWFRACQVVQDFLGPAKRFRSSPLVQVQPGDSDVARGSGPATRFSI